MFWALVAGVRELDSDLDTTAERTALIAMIYCWDFEVVGPSGGFHSYART